MVDDGSLLKPASIGPFDAVSIRVGGIDRISAVPIRWIYHYNLMRFDAFNAASMQLDAISIQFDAISIEGAISYTSMRYRSVWAISIRWSSIGSI